MQRRRTSLLNRSSRRQDFGLLSADWAKDMLEKHSAPKSPRIPTLAQTDYQHIPKLKAELKAMLPSLTPAEIRRFHVPHYEAVILELEELGSEYAAAYLKSLLEFDEEMRRKAGPGTVIWKKPRLRDQDKLIDRLRDGLIATEEAMANDEPATQTIDLLNTAIYFQGTTWEWWWIAEHLYQSAIPIAESIPDDDLTVTLARYLYGRFLFNEMQDPHNAIEHLNYVRDASDGKPWNASRILGEKQETIFRECNILLYKALLMLGTEMCEKDPQVAIKICEESLARATDSGHEEYITKALYKLGRCHLRAGDVKSALQHFAKLLAMAKRLPDPDGICNAHMKLAFAYKELDDNDGAEKHLRLFRETASKHGLALKLAQAYYYIGEHFLGRAKPELATFSLEKALHLYNEQGLCDEANRARCIAGVSKGQENMRQYIRLILQCGAGNKDATLKLLAWKNRRDLSWIDEERSDADLSDEKVDDSEVAQHEASTTTSASLIPNSMD